jgi:hypothetical protein
MFDKVGLVLLGIWGFLFGMLSLSNLDIKGAHEVMEASALVLGVMCIIRAFR